MPTIVFTLAGLVTLAAVSADATALPTVKAPADELGAGPPTELVRDGCGRGWHRHHWRDQWGYWHWGDCVPNGGPYLGWGEGRDYWRDPYPGWGAG